MADPNSKKGVSVPEVGADTIEEKQPLPFERPDVLGGCVYYSQNREDLVLLAFFPEDKGGFYVDVGGFDPDLDSVTKLFYLKGWHGINIEPQKAQYDKFVKRRKRDINLNIGISDHEDALKLRAYRSGGLSTFSKSMQGQYEAQPDDDTRDYAEHEVRVRPLRDVFAEQGVGHISFLKVDVEGLEYEVLHGNDWEKYRPEVICIESNHIEKDWRPSLRQWGYVFVFNDGLNDYYADERTDRANKFDYVKVVVHDRGGGIRADHYEMLTKLYEYASQKANHVDELIAERDKIKRNLEKEIAERDVELNSIRSTAGRLKRLLKRRIAGEK